MKDMNTEQDYQGDGILTLPFITKQSGSGFQQHQFD